MEGWRRDETGPCCVVKGDVDADDFRLRRGFPDKTDAATNRRWVTADTPPTSPVNRLLKLRLPPEAEIVRKTIG